MNNKTNATPVHMPPKPALTVSDPAGKATRITTRRTTRGIVISIVKFDTYQDLNNYASRTGNRKETAQKPPATPHDTEIRDTGNTGDTKTTTRGVEGGEDVDVFLSYWKIAYKNCIGHQYIVRLKDRSTVVEMLTAMASNGIETPQNVLIGRAATFLAGIMADSSVKSPLALFAHRFATAPHITQDDVEAYSSYGIWPPEGTDFMEWIGRGK